MEDDRIIWVASYPKSGNTWIRCLISSLIAGGGAPDMNGLSRNCPNGAARVWLEEMLDISTEDMTPDELVWFRAAVYRRVAEIPGGPRFVKLHDRYDPDLFPPEATAGTVYVVRDPRDVAPSWALHMNVSVETALERMGMSGFTLARFRDRHNDQMEQRLDRWSGHVSSWLDGAATERPLLLIRYEDLLADPATWVGRLASFLGIVADADVIDRTVSACRFEVLRGTEEMSGFTEKPKYMERFFRRGRAGGWRDALTPEQAARIVDRLGAMMARLGYLVDELASAGG